MKQSDAMEIGVDYIQDLLDKGHTVLIQDGGLAKQGRNRKPTAIFQVLGDLATLNTDGRSIQVVRIDD